MKIQIYSDIHNEFRHYEPKDTDADVVVLAGDIDTGLKAINWAWDLFKDKPVIYIAGNHEHYNRCIYENLKKTQVEVIRYKCPFFRKQINYN